MDTFLLGWTCALSLGNALIMAFVAYTLDDKHWKSTVFLGFLSPWIALGILMIGGLL